MTNHNHSDGVRPSLAQIRKRRAEGWFDHTVEPTIDVLLAELEKFYDAYLEARRDFDRLMHTVVDADHVPTPARGSSSDGQHCAVCRRHIWRKGLDEWAHLDVMA
jgi:hypothetical protein